MFWTDDDKEMDMDLDDNCKTPAGGYCGNKVCAPTGRMVKKPTK